jgi:SpoIIAA-like
MPPFRKLLAEVRIPLEEMSIQQNMHFQSGLLSVDASGEFSLEDAKQAFLELLKAIAHYQAEKILLDGRNMKGKPGDLERFYYGEFAARETHKLVVEHKIVPRFAYVIHEPLRDPTRLGETVAVNRGMNVKTFETAEDAIEWLTDVH